jgi:hypothetical protein
MLFYLHRKKERSELEVLDENFDSFAFCGQFALNARPHSISSILIKVR